MCHCQVQTPGCADGRGDFLSGALWPLVLRSVRSPGILEDEGTEETKKHNKNCPPQEREKQLAALLADQPKKKKTAAVEDLLGLLARASTAIQEAELSCESPLLTHSGIILRKCVCSAGINLDDIHILRIQDTRYSD